MTQHFCFNGLENEIYDGYVLCNGGVNLIQIIVNDGVLGEAVCIDL